MGPSLDLPAHLSDLRLAKPHQRLHIWKCGFGVASWRCGWDNDYPCGMPINVRAPDETFPSKPSWGFAHYKCSPHATGQPTYLDAGHRPSWLPLGRSTRTSSLITTLFGGPGRPEGGMRQQIDMDGYMWRAISRSRDFASERASRITPQPCCCTH